MANSEFNQLESEGQRGALIATADRREVAAPMVLQLGNQESNTGTTVSFNALWRALQQRMALAIPLAVVMAAICVTALWYFSEPKYRSLATLHIVEKQPYLAFPTTEHSADFAQTQIELIKGPFIIGRAIESEGLVDIPELREIVGKEDSVQWITQRLKAIRIGKSEIYEVSFSTKRPESARKICEAIVDTYMQFQTGETDTRRQRMLAVLEEELLRYDNKIELARTKLRELAKLAGGEDGMVMEVPANGSGPARTGGRHALLSSLQQKLVDAEVEVQVARARVQALGDETDSADADPSETPRDSAIPDSRLDELLEQNPGIIALNIELERKQQSLRVLRKDSKKYLAVQDEIATIQAQLETRRAELKPQILEQRDLLSQAEHHNSINKAQAEYQQKVQSANLLRERVATERNEQLQHSDKSLELAFARDELIKVELIRRHIADRAVHLTTESRAPAQVHNIQKATLPEFPEGPSLAKKLAVAGLAGFCAPFALLIGWDVLRRRVFELSQLEREFSVKLVSEVAVLPSRPLIPKPGSSRAYQRQLHMFQESVNSLRTTLSVNDSSKDKQVFVVASAVSGEGKSNLSAQLAMSWSTAVQGKVVIIDADLRSPSIHELFDIRRKPGLADVLRGECPVEDALFMDWSDRLFVLTAGSPQSNSPEQLFTGPRFREMLAKLRQHFDKIIIDVAPVLCASETLLIAKEADAVLICALHDYSQSGQVKQAYDRFVVGGVPVVGAVLNGVPIRGYSSKYRGYAPV